MKANEVESAPVDTTGNGRVTQANGTRRARKPTESSASAGENVTPFPASDVRRTVPGSPGWEYRPGEAVWYQGKLVLTWCPVVNRHLAAFDARGDLASRKVTIAVGQFTATVQLADVVDGGVWTNRIPAPGIGDKRVREVLRNIIDDQAIMLPVTPMHPRWVDGRLVLPPLDVLPRGYGVVAGTVDEFRALLLEIARAPRMVLICGLAVGGLYVGPLRHHSYSTHLPGSSSEGKTTGAIGGAAMFGLPGPLDDGAVMRIWSVTKQGPGAWARSLSTLPGFRDELGAAGLTPAQLESLMFQLLEGAERDRSSMHGDHQESPGNFRSSLTTTGNESILDRIANEGMAARILEFPAPVTLNAEHADRIDTLAERAHGHALMAIVDRGPTPDEFKVLVTQALEDIGQPSGGVPRRVAGHLAFGVAAARMLAELFSVPEFSAAVVEAAQAVLDDLTTRLMERGMKPADRLLAALAGSMASSPSLWPTRSEYGREVEAGGPVRGVLGWDVSDDRVPGEVAVVPTELSGIAEKAGIVDPYIALRELVRRGLLHRQEDGKNLARVINVNGKKQRAYLISGVAPKDVPVVQPEPLAGVDIHTAPEDQLVSLMKSAPDQADLIVAEMERRDAVDKAKSELSASPKTEPTPAVPRPRNSFGTRHKDRQAKQRELTEKATAALAGVCEPKELRLLAALEGPFAPLRGGRTPYQRPEMPGMWTLAHIIGGYHWERPYSGPVAVLDRSGAWPTAASSVMVAHGKLERAGEAEFTGRPGYYLIQRHQWRHEDVMPDPLAGVEGDTVWVPAPTVALLVDLVDRGWWPDVTILDSYTGDGVRIHEWATFVNTLRATAIREYGRNSAQYKAVKNSFGMSVGLMLGRLADDSMVRREWQCALRRPDWAHAIKAQASATLWRRADDCRMVGVQPVMMRNIDELLIPASGLEIVTSIPQGKTRAPVLIDQDGIKLGSFKVKETEQWGADK